ncbi:hypothetical protein J3F83DRAFT_314988 [Trichoderma novae-zelandiae]
MPTNLNVERIPALTALVSLLDEPALLCLIPILVSSTDYYLPSLCLCPFFAVSYIFVTFTIDFRIFSRTDETQRSPVAAPFPCLHIPTFRERLFPSCCTNQRITAPLSLSYRPSANNLAAAVPWTRAPRHRRYPSVAPAGKPLIGRYLQSRLHLLPGLAWPKPCENLFVRRLLLRHRGARHNRTASSDTSTLVFDTHSVPPFSFLFLSSPRHLG